MPRYAVENRLRCPAIVDYSTSRLFGFTRCFDLPEASRHRAGYTIADAQHICDWLNERAAGYPSGPPLLVRLP